MSTSSPTSPVGVPPSEPVTTPANIRWTLLGVMLGMLLAMLDNTIVSTSMLTIVGDLGGLDHISWVVTAYALATAVSTPVWGKCGDLYGRKHAYLTAIAVFLIGSVASGAAQSMSQLIAFRVIQGLGAGGLASLAFALIGSLVAPRERGRYQGMTATVMAVGTVGGPLLGGLITGHLGWRWAFYVNLPLGLVTFVWCQVMLKLPRQRTKAKIDWLGIVLMTITISSVVLAATWAGNTYAWGSWQIIGLFATALVGLFAFVASQKRAPEPVLPLRVFATGNYKMASIMVCAAGAAMFGATLYLPVFQQSVQGADATSSGLLLLPMVAPIALVSNIVGKVMSRTGKYKIFPIVGSACLSVGLFLLSTMDTDTSRLLTSLYMVLVGVGLGFLMQMTTTIAQNSVEMKDMGVASAGVTLFRTIGGSLGVAVFGSLFTRALENHLPGSGTGDSDLELSASALAGLPAGARDAYLGAVAEGTQNIFLVAAVICAAAFFAALAVKEVPLRGKPGGAPGPGPAGAATVGPQAGASATSAAVPPGRPTT
ncbi:transporter [Kitasatospora sp. Root187]|nr:MULTISPECIES: MDR family MFS transporter [unclassified Kitasatospora]KQV18700.1 transporter [Kitasatospora sp. Root107]KRB74682.1 transporter [Kitasatospora sp. Root187]